MIWAIAHRGASRDRPENTFAAFDAALEQGADGIELDVQLSRDGVPVVFHDRTLARAGGGRRGVGALDLGALEQLDAGASGPAGFHGERIPTLERVLERYGGKTRLLIEIKARPLSGGAARHAALARRVADLVAGFPDVHLLCFHASVLGVLEGHAPRIPRVLNHEPGRRISPVLARILPSLAALSVDVRKLTVGFAEAVRETGTPLFVYTCNTPAELHRAVVARPQAIMSDLPAWLAAELRALAAVS